MVWFTLGVSKIVLQDASRHKYEKSIVIVTITDKMHKLLFYSSSLLFLFLYILKKRGQINNTN